jgi:ribonucleoside-diphosphate reductase alpha chain
MLMRVSVGIHLDDLESVLETYDLMSKVFYTCIPTLFNQEPKTSNVFLFPFMQDDSIDGIYDTKQTAKSRNQQVE